MNHISTISKDDALVRIKAWAARHNIPTAWVEGFLKDCVVEGDKARVIFALPWGEFTFHVSLKRLSPPRKFLSAWNEAWTIKPENLPNQRLN